MNIPRHSFDEARIREGLAGDTELVHEVLTLTRSHPAELNLFPGIAPGGERLSRE